NPVRCQRRAAAHRARREKVETQHTTCPKPTALVVCSRPHAKHVLPPDHIRYFPLRLSLAACVALKPSAPLPRPPSSSFGSLLANRCFRASSCDSHRWPVELVE